MKTKEAKLIDASKIIVTFKYNYGNWEKGQIFFTQETYWSNDIDIEWKEKTLFVAITLNIQ